MSIRTTSNGSSRVSRRERELAAALAVRRDLDRRGPARAQDRVPIRRWLSAPSSTSSTRPASRDGVGRERGARSSAATSSPTSAADSTRTPSSPADAAARTLKRLPRAELRSSTSISPPSRRASLRDSASPRPVPACIARERALHLRERLEEPLDLLGRDPAAGVDDGDLERRAVADAVDQPTSIRTRAALGELDARCPTRLIRIWRRRVRSVSIISGHRADRRRSRARAPSRARAGRAGSRPRPRSRAASSARARPRACRPRSSTGRGCR